MSPSSGIERHVQSYKIKKYMYIDINVFSFLICGIQSTINFFFCVLFCLVLTII